MKQRRLSADEARELIAELRAMADLPPGRDDATLARATEIRFLLNGNAWDVPGMKTRADEAYADLEVLLRDSRWRSHDVDRLRKSIKSSCARLRNYLGL